MRKRRAARAAAVIAVAVILAGMRTDDALANAAEGKGLAGAWCAECHALEAGKPSPNPQAPAFPDLAADPVVTQYSIRLLLRSPHLTMPHIVLTDEQLDDVTDYILSLKPHG